VIPSSAGGAARGFRAEDFCLLVQAMAKAAEMGHLDEHLLERPFALNGGVPWRGGIWG